jgi:hypothetical protein
MKNAPWPWESAPEEWKKLLWKSIGVTIFNIFIIGPMTSYIDIAIFGFKLNMDVNSAPSVFTMLWQITVFLMAQ